MKAPGDIARNTAKWLFAFGCIWAIFVLPFVVLSVFDRAWLSSPLGIYSIIGSVTWLGWLWRARKTQSTFLAILFWLASTVVNFVPIQFIVGSGNLRATIQDGDISTAIILSWWLVATLASLVAFFFEFASHQALGYKPNKPLEPTG